MKIYVTGYFLLQINLLNKIEYITRNPAPIVIGMNKKLKDSFPKRIIIGFAPAGGWTVFEIIIKVTAKPTAMPMEIKLTPKKYKTIKPQRLEIICPKKIFFGWANGLECTEVIRTNEAPNDGINHKLVAICIFKYASEVKQIAVPNPAINAGDNRKFFI